MCWEVSLLAFLWGCVARGGMSFSAIFDVYTSLWGHTLAESMYGRREHFVKKLTCTMIAYASLQLLEASPLDFCKFEWFLRPHHIAEDFTALLVLVRQAFGGLAAQHDCHLFNAVPALILDGKWSVQTMLCNERGSGLTWSSALAMGFFRGCVRRPDPGSKYCSQHAKDCLLPPEQCQIGRHREVRREDGLLLEYEVDGAWLPAASVPPEQVRAYEMTLLRRRDRDEIVEEADSCAKLSFFILPTLNLQSNIFMYTVGWQAEGFSCELPFYTNKQANKKTNKETYKQAC